MTSVESNESVGGSKVISGRCAGEWCLKTATARFTRTDYIIEAQKQRSVDQVGREWRMEKDGHCGCGSRGETAEGVGNLKGWLHVQSLRQEQNARGGKEKLTKLTRANIWGAARLTVFQHQRRDPQPHQPHPYPSKSATPPVVCLLRS